MAEVVGLSNLKALFAQLPDRIGNNVAVGGLRASAQVFRQDAIARAPVLQQASKFRKAGTVKKNIVIRRSKTTKFGMFVGVQPYSRLALQKYKKSQKAKGLKVSRKEAGAFKKALAKEQISPDDPFYWWFVEFGTSKMPAQSFMRAAFEAKKFEAVSAFETYSQGRVEKEAGKLARDVGMPQ